MSGAFVLAAGGTGGHLFPAQALASELLRRGRRVVVMTDGRGHNYGTAFPGAEIATIPAATFEGRSPLRWLASSGIIGAGIASALGKLRRIRPRAVVGFGGYPSFPVIVAAWLARIPCVLHEQNAVLGRVNRLVAPIARRITASVPFARHAPKDMSRVVFTGSPVRPEAEALAGASYSAPDKDGPIHLLVFGGSQGARALSEIVPAALTRLHENLRRRLEVTQQCRPEDVAAVESAYRAAGIKAEVARFYDDLPRRMADAHLVISRSGASTLSELTVVGRPAILIPYPFAMDDHQAANAAVLEEAGAAWMVRQSALNPDVLARMLEEILGQPRLLAAHAAAAARLGHPHAASRLADVVEATGAEG